MNYPTISVIIPRKVDESAEEAIQAVLQSDYPQHFMEIIEVIGESPSKQRNRGAAISSGEILYFLDNDSIVRPNLFSRIVKYYLDSPICVNDQPEGCEELAGVGGPNLTPKTDGFLQKISGYAFASPFAALKMCARFKSTGKMRFAGEQELILCNLSIRKKSFLRENGFNESMYPNEENEFINRLMQKGYKFIYDPDAFLYRSRRNHFWGFIRQLFNYGGGRADQILVEGFSRKSLLFFLPSGLFCYLILFTLLNILEHFLWWSFLPLALYGGLATLSALQFAIQERNPLLAGILPIWYLLMHLSYGTGLLHGFWEALSPLKKDSTTSSPPVKVIFRKKLNTLLSPINPGQAS